MYNRDISSIDTEVSFTTLTFSLPSRSSFIFSQTLSVIHENISASYCLLFGLGLGKVNHRDMERKLNQIINPRQRESLWGDSAVSSFTDRKYA